MNILHYTSSFPIDSKDVGGNFIRELIETISGSFRFFVLTPDAPESKVHEKIGNCEVFRYRYFFKRKQILVCGDSIVQNLKSHKGYYLVLPFFLMSAFFYLLKIVKQKEIDIVHAHWIFPQGFIAVAARLFSQRKYKVLVTSHGTDINLYDNFFLRKFISYTLKKCDAVNSVSHYLKNKIAGIAGNEAKITVIPMGTDVEAFAEKNFDTPADPEKYILYVGRLTEGKDIPRIIKAFKSVREEFPDLFLYLAGTGNELDKLKSLALSLGVADSVRFLGQVGRNKLAFYYRNAQMLVSASLTEGFGLVFVEALLSLCPVVATDVGGVKEIIVDGETGLLLKPADQKGLEKSIKMLLTDKNLRGRLIENGYARAKKNFSWNAVGVKFSNLYLSLR